MVGVWEWLERERDRERDPVVSGCVIDPDLFFTLNAWNNSVEVHHRITSVS